MKVDSQKIIADTLEVFSKSTAQKEKYSKIKEYISTHDYLELHTNFLTPTTIKINSDQFLKEIPSTTPGGVTPKMDVPAAADNIKKDVIAASEGKGPPSSTSPTVAEKTETSNSPKFKDTSLEYSRFDSEITLT